MDTNEESIIYPYDINMSMLNAEGIIKPGGYQAIMSDVAERHLKYLHLSIDELSKYGMAWVLISSSFEIIRPICGAIKILGHTWYSQQKGLLFRRDFSFTDEAGLPLFNAATFSVLIDLSKRKIIRPVNLPFNMSNPINILAMDASSHMRNKAAMSICDRRKIYPSYIDSIGHTNNNHYSEFVYDAFNESELKNLINISRIDLYFISELRLGDYFTVRRGFENDGTLIIDGLNESTGKESFACKITFKN